METEEGIEGEEEKNNKDKKRGKIIKIIKLFGAARGFRLGDVFGFGVSFERLECFEVVSFFGVFFQIFVDVLEYCCNNY